MLVIKLESVLYAVLFGFLLLLWARVLCLTLYYSGSNLWKLICVGINGHFFFGPPKLGFFWQKSFGANFSNGIIQKLKLFDWLLGKVARIVSFLGEFFFYTSIYFI